MLNKIKEIKLDRRIAKQKRIKKEKERERIRIEEAKERERIEEERLERNSLKMPAMEQIKREFLEKEGLEEAGFGSRADYQEAKQYLLRNGFNWSDLKKMSKDKIYFEANSLLEYKAKKENVLIDHFAMMIAQGEDNFSKEIQRKISNRVEKLKNEKDELI